MRKADYAWLANAIRLQAGIADQNRRVAPLDDMADRHYLRGKADALRELGFSAAASLSVDRATFLKACGIDP